MNLNCKTFDSMLLAMGPFSESERSIINYALDLREAVRVLADGWRWEKSLPYNPIAAAAVEAARNQAKGTQ